jgi:hypothetical protein
MNVQDIAILYKEGKPQLRLYIYLNLKTGRHTIVCGRYPYDKEKCRISDVPSAKINKIAEGLVLSYASKGYKMRAIS